MTTNLPSTPDDKQGQKSVENRDKHSPKAAISEQRRIANGSKPTDNATNSTSSTRHTPPGDGTMDNTNKPTRPLSDSAKTTDKHTISTFATTLGIINTLALIGLAGVGYTYFQHQAQHHQQQTLSLQDHIDKLTPQLSQLEQSFPALERQLAQIHQQIATLSTHQEQQQQAVSALSKQTSDTTTQLSQLTDHVSQLSAADLDLWSLSEANFLINSAARKLFIDSDVKAARALLSNAELAIRDLNDPSLLTLRQAIQADLTTLAELTPVDTDGISLTLNQVATNLDKLPLKVSLSPAAQDEAPTEEVSSKLSEWRSNLTKTWHWLVHNIINIRRVASADDAAKHPELTANQSLYLRENIRFQLLSAQQAARAHQQQSFEQALTPAIAWITHYYDHNDPATQHTLATLTALQQQPVVVTLPDNLASLPLINRLFDKRLHQITQQTLPQTQSKD